MARQYAPSYKLPGLSGRLVTYQGGEFLAEGDPLEPGATFDVLYEFTARFPDAEGTIYEGKFVIELQDISTGVSNADLIAELQAKRRELRERAKDTAGPPVTTL